MDLDGKKRVGCCFLGGKGKIEVKEEVLTPYNMFE